MNCLLNLNFLLLMCCYTFHRPRLSPFPSCSPSYVKASSLQVQVTPPRTTHYSAATTIIIATPSMLLQLPSWSPSNLQNLLTSSAILTRRSSSGLTKPKSIRVASRVASSRLRCFGRKARVVGLPKVKMTPTRLWMCVSVVLSEYLVVSTIYL